MKITVKTEFTRARFKLAVYSVFKNKYALNMFLWGLGIFVIIIGVGMWRGFRDAAFYYTAPLAAFGCFMLYPAFVWFDYWRRVKAKLNEREHGGAVLNFDGSNVIIDSSNGRFTSTISTFDSFLKTRGMIILFRGGNPCGDMLKREFPDARAFDEFAVYLKNEGVRDITRRRGFFTWLFRSIFALFLLAGYLAGVVYYDLCGRNIKDSESYLKNFVRHVLVKQVTVDPSRAGLREALAGCDLIVVRTGGFRCCYQRGKNNKTVFTITDPAEIKDFISHLEFTPAKLTNSENVTCECCGEYGIDFMRGGDLLAETATHSDGRMRWRGFSTTCFRVIDIPTGFDDAFLSEDALAFFKKYYGVLFSYEKVHTEKK